MKIKTSQLTGILLDWAVATAKGYKYIKIFKPQRPTDHGWIEVRFNPDIRATTSTFSPSINWSQGGPIIERELICYNKSMDTYWTWLNNDAEGDRNPRASGPTLLIAAMRCYVASKLGEEVEIPEELK